MHIRAFVQNVLGDTHGKSLNQIEGLPHNMRADNLGNFRIVRGLGEVVGCSSLREVGVQNRIYHEGLTFTFLKIKRSVKTHGGNTGQGNAVAGGIGVRWVWHGVP